MKKQRKAGSHGAVSVFLAIILVPCLVFTCVFVDLSRVQLAKAMTESAGDLALYSLMARYDEDLKEFYGLVGSCQDINEFYEVTATYFEGMLQAEGVSGEGSQLFLEYLRQLQNEGYADFLRMEFEDDTKVSATKNGAMGDNAALIEDGIVEFMKYRGPAALVERLIDRFSSLGLSSSMESINEDKEVSDAKQVYAEKQGDLLKKAFYSYLAIREYDQVQQNDQVPSLSGYSVFAGDLEKIRDDLRAVTSLVTKYYFPGTENLSFIQFPSFSLPADEYDPKDVGTEQKDGEGNVSYVLNAELLEELTEDLDTDLQAIRDAATAFVDSTASIPAPTTGTNYVVYCLKMQQVIASSGVVSTMTEKGDAVLDTYAKLEAAGECDPADDLPADWEQQITDRRDDIEEVFEDYLDKNATTTYMTRVGQYESTASTVVPKVTGQTYTFTSKYTGANETLRSFASKMTGRLATYRSALSKQIERLDLAINGGDWSEGKQVVSLNELQTAAGDFRQSREDWGSAASKFKGSSDYAADEYELYSNAETVASTGTATDPEDEAAGEALAAQITAESVQELKDRLVNIRDDAKACKNAIDNFLYGDSAAYTLTSANSLIQAACTVVPANESYSLDEAESAAGGYFQSLMSPKEGTIYAAPQKNAAANGNDPSLNNATPALYKYMKEQFKGEEKNVEDRLKENETQEEEYDNKSKSAEADAKGVNNNYLAGKGDNLTDSHGGKAVSLLSSLDSVITIASNLINGSGDELRDQLYVCEYIMDMFSYSTINNEGKYNLILKGDAGVTQDTNVSWKDFPYDAAKTAWETEDARSVMGNQSLTNRPITKANNHANLGEVEYILYGNKSIDANLATSYGNIYALRMMLNTVSGFCNFYGNTTITTIAGAVATVTCGIVPVPVTKCVLILVLSALESAKDLERLKAGARVELYKATSDDWVFGVKEASELVADFAESAADSDPEPESGLYYSDYMYIFLLVGLTGDDTYEPMLLRVGDLIQANMRKAGDTEFSLSKTISYFTLTAKVRVKPLMLTLPIVSTVEGGNDLRQATDWCTFDHSTIRGYS